jgi:hypothetical protein
MDGTDIVNANDTKNPNPIPESVASGISAHSSTPDRVVFTEDGNSDGWIAMDADRSVPLER